jgi:hypothetical protein
LCRSCVLLLGWHGGGYEWGMSVNIIAEKFFPRSQLVEVHQDGSERPIKRGVLVCIGRRGEYVTERATEFWSVRQADDCLAGERKTMGSDLVCLPIRFTGKALLVSLTDTNGKQWFSWIHP